MKALLNTIILSLLFSNALLAQLTLPVTHSAAEFNWKALEKKPAEATITQFLIPPGSMLSRT